MSPRQQKLNAKIEALRKEFFPDVADRDLWTRQASTGFVTVPRSMPLIMTLIDSLSKGKPVGTSYLALWARAWDSPFVILGPKLMESALEAGFDGQRAVNSFTSRLSILDSLGLVRFAEGAAGKYHYALILNPYLVLKRHEKKLGKAKWNTLRLRMSEIGATDLDPPEETEQIPDPAPATSLPSQSPVMSNDEIASLVATLPKPSRKRKAG